MPDPVQGESELLKDILGDTLPLDAERVAIQRCLAANPTLAPPLLSALVTQKHRWRTLFQQSERQYAELAKTLDDTPWMTASFLEFVASGDRALVAAGGRRVIVRLDPRVDAAALAAGDLVYLAANQSAVVGIGGRHSQPGVVGELSRVCDAGARAVVRAPAGEEIVVDLAAALRDEAPVPGDLLLYDRESAVAYERLERRRNGVRLLEELPLDFTRERLGGLDAIFDELSSDVRLMLRSDIVERFHLPPTRGVLLCGPPGTGKTSLVRALGEHLQRTLRLDVKLLLVRPGIHRSMWYGASEQHVRDLFREAADAAEAEGSYALLFFDDVDHLGSRDSRAGGDIDARLLPCFLQEIDAMRSPRLVLIGATNREDLLDEALLRPGRFGRIFRTGRPGRQQAREILRRHLTADLPLHYSQGGATSASDVIEDLLATVYAPNGELSVLATLTFRDGSRRPLLAAQVMSGAVIAAAVDAAKRSGCIRALAGDAAVIDAADLRAAMAHELASIAERLKPGPSLAQMIGLATDHDVVRIDPHRRPGDALTADHLQRLPEEETPYAETQSVSHA